MYLFILIIGLGCNVCRRCGVPGDKENTSQSPQLRFDLISGHIIRIIFDAVNELKMK